MVVNTLDKMVNGSLHSNFLHQIIKRMYDFFVRNCHVLTRPYSHIRVLGSENIGIEGEHPPAPIT